MNFDFETSTMHCPHCGYKRGTGLDEWAEEIRAKGTRPTVSITHEDRYSPRAISLFYTAHDHLWQKKQSEALDALQNALDIQPDFAEAHLWMAKLSEDEKAKREHLSAVLANDPTHLEATRMMLVLNGRLTPDQAERSHREQGPEIRVAGSPVGTTTTVLKCPNCGGDLTTDEWTGQVKCKFCGYTRQQTNGHSGEDSLVAALLERRAQPVKWVVGARILHCNECGAERTMTASQLSTRCPFCGSNHVIEQDALNSFQQPDGLIPFRISRDEAGARIKAQLKTFSEKLKGWFDTNQVARATLNGYYLPFWVFDATVEVVRTRTYMAVDNGWQRATLRYATVPQQMTSRETYTEIPSDVEVCAVKSPPLALTGKLGDYDLTEMVGYDPELLAMYPAELYSLDFDEAALEARSLISSATRARYGRREPNEDNNVSISVFNNFLSMNFQLVLMPVWIANLVEVDQDKRTALVNGQTGTVALGKTEKARR
jgi:DNA-directed RNA polymerase subunit RPC12/RpoP